MAPAYTEPPQKANPPLGAGGRKFKRSEVTHGREGSKFSGPVLFFFPPPSFRHAVQKRHAGRFQWTKKQSSLYSGQGLRLWKIQGCFHSTSKPFCNNSVKVHTNPVTPLRNWNGRPPPPIPLPSPDIVFTTLLALQLSKQFPMETRTFSHTHTLANIQNIHLRTCKRQWEPVEIS